VFRLLSKFKGRWSILESSPPKRCTYIVTVVSPAVKPAQQTHISCHLLGVNPVQKRKYHFSQVVLIRENSFEHVEGTCFYNEIRRRTLRRPNHTTTAGTAAKPYPLRRPNHTTTAAKPYPLRRPNHTTTGSYGNLAHVFQFYCLLPVDLGRRFLPLTSVL